MCDGNMDLWVRCVFDLIPQPCCPVRLAPSLILSTDTFTPSWTQSPRVEVVISALDALHIPRELLRSRSPLLRSVVDRQQGEEGSATVHLKRVNVGTLKRFYRWSLSEEPSIPESTTQEELEELGYLAEKYQVYALEHQVVDKFNDKFHDDSGTSKWTVRADMVSRIYQKCGPASCLRGVFRAALRTVGPERLLREWEEWSQVAGVGGDLGTDLLRAVAETGEARVLDSRWGAKPLRVEDACRFHNHERQNFPVEMARRTGLFASQVCPFRGVECFPVGFTEEESPRGARVKERKYKKGERIRQLLGELRMDEAPGEATLEAVDGEPNPGDDDLPAEEPGPEPGPGPEPDAEADAEAEAEAEAELELGPEPAYNTPAAKESEPEQDSIPAYDGPAAEVEDCWGLRSTKDKKKKKKKKNLCWEERPDSPVMVDRPADTAVPEETSGE